MVNSGVVEVRRAKKGLLRRNQFRLVLRFANREVFLHSETYTNHAYLVDVGQQLADEIGWRFEDSTGISDV